LALLTIDLGNTRAKLRVWAPESEPGGELVRLAGVALDADSTLAEHALSWLKKGPPCQVATIAEVAEPELGAALRRALEPVVRGPVVRADAGLENQCSPPEETGDDRLLAARGALELFGEACVVVDAGTALTVDAVRPAAARSSPGESRGCFLGGAIAPGPELMAAALARGGARLECIEPRPGVAALGRGTTAALEAGVVLGFRGAARELVGAVEADAGWRDAPVVLTGGARGLLLEPEPFLERSIREEPELVQRGLLWACRRVLGAEAE